MKVLFLGGVFDESHNDEIIYKTRTYVEYAANNFQKKIIYGLRACNVPLEVVSIPFLGAYPKAYSDVCFSGFANMDKDKSGYRYYNFNNIFGYRNFSRYHAAKKGLLDFVKYDDDQKLIIVYSPHTPFIQAANWAKRIDRRIKVCMVVPDLPQYMNLSDNQSIIYRCLKYIDIKQFKYENKSVDSYIILTEQMSRVLKIGSRPYEVVEGIYEAVSGVANKEIGVRKIVYTGKLNNAFGVLNLVKAFIQIPDPNIRLVICGEGEAKDEIVRIAADDTRIDFKGQVSSDVARQCILDGDILVNPRQNYSEYTKYSFPSKIIDYLATANPVVAYRLDGMPEQYSDFIYYVPQNTIESLRDTILDVLNASEGEIRTKTAAALSYINANLSREAVAKKILSLNFLR